jgi:uroporphyrinogen decarboxylase
MISSHQRFLSACQCQPLDRPPVWIMRQAGRYLPEYRALKERYSFLELAKTPELALEVTLQPLKRFPLDAAILFSDILVIPEAMGQPYSFRDKGGIQMDFAVKTKEQLDQLSSTNIPQKLEYIDKTLRLLKSELADEKALLGFAGSPWTLATYMVEGGSSSDLSAVKELFYSDRLLFDQLLEKITKALVDYLKMQIDAGVDAIQIFDSWGGTLSGNDYEEASLKWIRTLIAEVGSSIPIILYAKGTYPQFQSQLSSGAKVISLDWTVDLAQARSAAPDNIALQGNLDPVILNTTPEIVEREATKLLKQMKDKPGYIFNLGHGIQPTAKIECMEALVATVTNFS